MRIIHRFDFKGLDVVKGINFEGLRPVAKIQNLISAWGRGRIKELHFQGALTSLHNTHINHEIVKVAKSLLLRPITVGGGIKSVAEAQQLIAMGADRIAVNTSIFEDLNFYKELVTSLGVSTVVVAIDVSRINGEYFCFINNGRDNTDVTLSEYLRRYDMIEKPEILITFIDGDGTCNSACSDLMELAQAYSGPTILSGGISRMEDVLELKKKMKHHSGGVSIGKAFHNFILDEAIDLGDDFAFASRFDITARSGKSMRRKLDPMALTQALNNGEKN